MARTKLNWVKETSTDTGTGVLDLSGSAPTGYRTFVGAGVSNGTTFIAIFEGQTSGAKEASHCTFNTGSPNTITRNTLIASSTGSFIDWSGETIHISMGPEASYTMTGDMAQFWATAVTIASADASTIAAADSNVVNVTGTTTISGLGTPTPATAAKYVWLLFAGVLQLTHHATQLVLPAGGSNIATAAGDRALFVHEGSGNWRCLVYQRASGQAVISSTAAAAPSITRAARTSNTMLGTSDVGKLIDITSGTFTQTFDAAATLGAGWSVWIKNSGTGIVTLDPNSTEQIDGLTSYPMYPGELRLVTCSGTAFFSVVEALFAHKFTSSATFTKPPGYSGFQVSAQGGGGGGGSGRRGAGAADKAGGGGGGGGGRHPPKFIAAADVGATESVTVGAGGTGGTAVTANDTNGNDGTDGGTSSFGTHVVATGGKKGSGGTSGGVGAGGAGGSVMDFAAASSGTAGTELKGAGDPSDPGLSAIHGGGSGGRGSITNSATNHGGSSAFGAAGGGAGGSENSANTLRNGAAGGVRGATTIGSGGTAGTSHASSPTAGGAGTAPGMGGGGGGAAQSAAAAAGGAGSDGGGGGGGGCSRNGNNSGAGGAGGDGHVLVEGVA